MKTVPDSYRNSFLGILFNTGWLTIARVSGDLMGVLLFIGISRNLGLDATGEYSFAFAVAALVAAAVGVGLEEYGLREYSRLGDVAERRAMFRSIMGLQFNLLLASIAALVVFVAFANASLHATVVVLVVTLHVLTFQFAIMYFIPAFASHKMLVPAVAEFICRVGAMCVCTLLVMVAGQGLIVGMAPLALGTSLLCLFAVFSARHYNGELALSLSPTSMRTLLAKTWPFALSTIIYNVFNRISVVLLTALRGHGETGIYATALKLYEFGTMPLYLMGIAVFPALSRTHGEDEEQFCSTADKFLRTALAVAAVLAWGLIFVAPPLLGAFLGPEFTRAGSATQLMSIVSILGALDIVCMRVILAMNKQTLRVRVQAVAVGCNVVLNILLIPSLGARGSIAATIATQVIMITCYFTYLYGEVAMRRLLRTLASFALIAAVTVGVTLIVAFFGMSLWYVAGVALLVLATMVVATGFVRLPSQFLRRAVA